MDKKVVIITGGLQGIGKSCAQRFAESGFSIAINDVKDENDSIQYLDDLKSAGADVFYFKADVTIPEQCEEFVNKVVEKFGRIDVLVNNAGITKDNLFIRMSPKEWEAVIGINLTGVFNITKPAVKIMMKQRYGAIVNMSSVSGVMGNPGQANYSSSKAGLIGLTKTLAKELATRNIRVNAVAPGFIDTAMTEKLDREKLSSFIPMARLGKSEEIAEVVFFLAEIASYVTGQVINVDGGIVM